MHPRQRLCDHLNVGRRCALARDRLRPSYAHSDAERKWASQLYTRARAQRPCPVRVDRRLPTNTHYPICALRCLTRPPLRRSHLQLGPDELRWLPDHHALRPELRPRDYHPNVAAHRARVLSRFPDAFSTTKPPDSGFSSRLEDLIDDDQGEAAIVLSCVPGRLDSLTIDAVSLLDADFDASSHLDLLYLSVCDPDTLGCDSLADPSFPYDMFYKHSAQPALLSVSSVSLPILQSKSKPQPTVSFFSIHSHVLDRTTPTPTCFYSSFVDSLSASTASTASPLSSDTPTPVYAAKRKYKPVARKVKPVLAPPPPGVHLLQQRPVNYLRTIATEAVWCVQPPRRSDTAVGPPGHPVGSSAAFQIQYSVTGSPGRY